jgi:hypothetical protein
MRRWIPALFGALGVVLFGGWLGLYADLRELPRWADILIASPVTKIDSFIGQVFFHNKEVDVGVFFVPVAVLYCASIGALVGFGSSFLFSRKAK